MLGKIHNYLSGFKLLTSFVSNPLEVLRETYFGDTTCVRCKSGFEFSVSSKLVRQRFVSILAMLCQLSNHFRVKVHGDNVYVDGNYVSWGVIPAFFKLISRTSIMLDVDPSGRPIIRFFMNGKLVNFTLFEGLAGLNEIYETFFGSLYDVFDYKNKVVMDVGAFIGDTPIYFALNGASRVYAFEPSPSTYELAKHNILANNLANTILLENVGVGAEDGSLKFYHFREWPSSSGAVAKLEENKMLEENKISIMTVNVLDVVRVLDEVGEVDILKLDCEGCEFEVIPRLYNSGAIRMIKKGIVMEVHENPNLGTLGDILHYLHKSGFKTDVYRKSKSKKINLYMVKAWRSSS